MPSITSVNSTIMISVAGLFDTPQPLEGYTAEDIFTTEQIDAAEISMGLDGIQSAGFVPSAVTQTFSLQANSPSIQMFDDWYANMKRQQDVYFADGVIVLLSLRKKYTMVHGVLRNYTPVSDAQRVLRSRRFVISWQSIDPESIAPGAI